MINQIKYLNKRDKKINAKPKRACITVDKTTANKCKTRDDSFKRPS